MASDALRPGTYIEPQLRAYNQRSIDRLRVQHRRSLRSSRLRSRTRFRSRRVFLLLVVLGLTEGHLGVRPQQLPLDESPLADAAQQRHVVDQRVPALTQVVLATRSVGLPLLDDRALCALVLRPHVLLEVVVELQTAVDALGDDVRRNDVVRVLLLLLFLLLLLSVFVHMYLA